MPIALMAAEYAEKGPIVLAASAVGGTLLGIAIWFLIKRW